MVFAFSPELLAYMQKKGRRTVAVEIASSDHSDFEISELFVHIVSERHAQLLIDEKHFHPRETDDGLRVLLPNYRLRYDENVSFGLKKVLCFRSVTYSGIRL